MTNDEFDRIWSSMTDNEKKVAQEYPFAPSKAEAARRADLSPSTVYSYDDKVWDAASELVNKRKDAIVDGLGSLSGAALKTLRKGLEDSEEITRVQMEMAKYVLNQIEGKPTRKQQIEHSGGIDVGEDDINNALDHLG